MEYRAAGLTDVGKQRENNEDNFSLSPEHGLFVVADGMGGHKGGHIASRMAAEAVKSFFDLSSSDEVTWPFSFDPERPLEENRLITGIRYANKQIHDSSVQDRELTGMGTTVVSLLVMAERKRALIAHVGDSRAYRLRGDDLMVLTRDHSLYNDYVHMMPHLSNEQRDHLPRNVITRALGMQDTVAIDMRREDLLAGDCFLLCSDGLTSMVDDARVAELLKAHRDDPDRAAKELVAAANAEGGEDNVTAVVVSFA